MVYKIKKRPSFQGRAANQPTPNQTEQSIEGQLQDNYARAKRQGVTVIAEYIDQTTTGIKDTRADFQRILVEKNTFFVK